MFSWITLSIWTWLTEKLYGKSWLLQRHCSSSYSRQWAQFWWLENTYLAACSAWSLPNLWTIIKSRMRHVTNLVTLEQILKQLLNSCFSPPNKKSLKKKDASKEEVARVVDWDLCGFGSTADCCVTWVRHRLLSATWNITVQLSSLNLVCTESICWQFGTKTLKPWEPFVPEKGSCSVAQAELELTTKPRLA